MYLQLFLFIFFFQTTLSLYSSPKTWKHSNSSISGVHLSSNTCNIEKRKGISRDEFVSTYEANRIPVSISSILFFISRNSLFDQEVIERDPSVNKQFQHKCERDYLLQNYSNVTVTLSTANTFSYDKKKVKLSQYLWFFLCFCIFFIETTKIHK